MAIYGVALLAACVIAGLAVGEFLGWLIGVKANVGGVGVAMLLLVTLCQGLRRLGWLGPLTQQGVLFWSAMYIPIVVAMAASQDVAAALREGPVAILSGTLAVVACFALVPVLCRFGVPTDKAQPKEAAEDRHG